MGSLLNKLRDKKANPIHSFFEFSLTTCCLPGTAWGSRGAVMNTTDTTPLVYSLSGKMVIRHIITVKYSGLWHHKNKTVLKDTLRIDL